MACRHLIAPACGCPREDSEPRAVTDESREDLDEEDAVERQNLIAQAFEQLRRANAEMGRRSLADFVKQAFVKMHPDTILEWGPHIQALCDHVQWQLQDRGRALVDQEFKMRAQNILINVAPRSMKTIVLTLATLWCWLHWPSTKIKYLSTNPHVALNSGRMVHDLIAGTGPAGNWFRDTFRPTWALRRDQAAPSDMTNTAGGKRESAGLDARITGTGADVIYIDDPHDLKDSSAQIERACNDYDVCVHNRINDPRTSIRAVIMQRLSLNDLAARLLLTKAWIHIRIPMHFKRKTMCACGTCVGTNVFGWKDWRVREGEVMHPRFTTEFLEAERVRLNMHNASNEAQMEQEPLDLTSGLVQRDAWSFARLVGEPLGQWPRPPGCMGTNEGDAPTQALLVPRKGEGWDFDSVCISVDCANKDTKNGSRYGILACATRQERRFVLEDGSKRGKLSDIIQGTIVPMIKKWRPSKLLIEDKAAGPTMIDELNDAVAAGKIRDDDGNAILCQVVVIGADAAGGSKETRLAAQLRCIESRLVHLIDGAGWLAEFVKELSLFPRGFSDRVDALSQFLAHYRTVGGSTLDIRWTGSRLDPVQPRA